MPYSKLWQFYFLNTSIIALLFSFLLMLYQDLFNNSRGVNARSHHPKNWFPETIGILFIFNFCDYSESAIRNSTLSCTSFCLKTCNCPQFPLGRKTQPLLGQHGFLLLFLLSFAYSCSPLTLCPEVRVKSLSFSVLLNAFHLVEA